MMQLARIRRGLWLVVLVAMIAMAATVFAAERAGAQYTGRAALSIGSLNRAPEQDTVLAQGYVDYFNEGSYQQRLRSTVSIPGNITFSARVAAASPIIYVEGVGPDPDAVRTAVATMATAFRNDVNSGIQADESSRIAALKQQIAIQQEALNASQPNSQAGNLASQTISQLQTSITEIQADTSNQLQELQMMAGVAQVQSNLAVNLALALAGGLVLGMLAALALAALRNRLFSATEVEDQLGVSVLAEVPGGTSAQAEQEREQRLKRLANLVGLLTTKQPATVAVVAARRSAASTLVAEALANHRAGLRDRSVLVRADLHGSRTTTGTASGVSDVLSRWPTIDAVSLLRPVDAPGLQVLPVGAVDEDAHRLFAADRLEPMLAGLAKTCDWVIIDAPPLLETSEAQVICATADYVIMVIDSGVTRVPAAREALRMLTQVGNAPLGCVLVDPRAAARASATEPTANAPARFTSDDRSSESGTAEPEPARAATDPVTCNEPPPSTLEDSTTNGIPRQARPRPSPRPRPHAVPTEGERAVESAAGR
jgi:Mrp family chromosome partitioning ATPase